MRRRNTLHHRLLKPWAILAAAIVIGLLLSGCGAPAPKVYHIGIISSNKTFDLVQNGFKAKMAELGYIENKNVTYIVETANPDQADRDAHAKKLVDAKVDLIFAAGTPDTQAAQTATKGTTIPVVFAYGQIEGTNLVASVREPGGNMTGVRYPGPEMIARRVEVLAEMVPTVKRVWVGYRDGAVNDGPALDALRPAAKAQGITLVEVPAKSLDDIKADLAARAKASDPGIDAIVTMPDEFNTAPDAFGVLSAFAAESKVPIAGGVASQANGSLFINSTDLKNVGALAAPLADKVLKGTNPGTIPVVTPEQTLVINTRMAQQLNVTVPDGLLKLASDLIK